MSQEQTDRRRHQRIPLATGVQFYHAQAQRDFPGRSVDVSGGGMLMYVPATVPVHPGQTLRVNMGRLPAPELGSMPDRPMDATIVRVDRNALLSTGHIAVGVRFFQE